MDEQRVQARLPLNWPDGAARPTLEDVERAIRKGEKRLREAELERRDKIRPLSPESGRRRIDI